MNFDNLRAGSVYLDRNGKKYSQDVLSRLLTNKARLRPCFIAAGYGWKQGVLVAQTAGRS